MTSILDDILSKLKNHTFTFDVPKENISDVYPVDVPDFRKPYIFVREIVNTTDLATYTNKENYSILSYEIEIYARAQSVDGTLHNARYVVKTLGSEIDELLSVQFGTIRDVSPRMTQYENDKTLMRYLLTETVIASTDTEFLYRR